MGWLHRLLVRFAVLLFFFLKFSIDPRGEGVEGLLGVGGVHHDEICRYPRLCYVSHVLCAIKDSNADY